MLTNHCIKAVARSLSLIAAGLIGVSAHAYVVNFNNLTSGPGIAAEGPIRFSWVSIVESGVNNFGNPAPSLIHQGNNGGTLFSTNWQGSTSYYLSSLEVGPSVLQQSGPGFSVSGLLNGSLQWTLSGHPNIFGKIDLSRTFTPDGRALSTIEINSTSFVLTSQRATLGCCVTNYLDNIDFSPIPVPTTPTNVAMPTVVSGGTFHFNVPTVTLGQLLFIDPVVAIGYEYVVGAGNPKFASVILPNIGDGLFEVEFFDGAMARRETVLQGRLFSFGGTGVSSFRVTGIEASAGLDPNDPAAFVTGLIFADSGSFTGTMTPLTAVSEPSSLILLSAGLLVIGAAKRKHWNTLSILPRRALSLDGATL